MYVIITGGSTGIGEGMVRQFLEDSTTETHTVCFTYHRHRAAAHTVWRTLHGRHCHPSCVLHSLTATDVDVPTTVTTGRGCRLPLPLQLDQGDPGSIARFTTHIKHWLERDGRSRLDCLINNAALGSATVRDYLSAKVGVDACTGVLMEGASMRMREQEALMRVNALGPLWVTESLLPQPSSHRDDGRPRTRRCLSTAADAGGR